MRVLIALLIVTVGASCAVPLDQINGARKTGSVVLKVEPPDAKVYLDGTYIGRAGRFDGTRGVLHVALGTHVLKFTAEEFENELREVASMESPQTVAVKMLPKPKPALPE